MYDNFILTRLCVITFENDIVFLIKLFFHMTRKLRQKLKYLENEKIF